MVEHIGLYTWQVCPNPKDIRARIVSTKEIVPKTGMGIPVAYDQNLN